MADTMPRVFWLVPGCAVPKLLGAATKEHHNLQDVCFGKRASSLRKLFVNTTCLANLRQRGSVHGAMEKPHHWLQISRATRAGAILCQSHAGQRTAS